MASTRTKCCTEFTTNSISATAFVIDSGTANNFIPSAKRAKAVVNDTTTAFALPCSVLFFSLIHNVMLFWQRIHSKLVEMEKLIFNELQLEIRTLRLWI